MNESEYVKDLGNGTWEVKLGAGIIPVKLTDSDRQYLANYAMSTCDIYTANIYGHSLPEVAAAAAKVNEFVHNKIKCSHCGIWMPKETQCKSCGAQA